MLEERTTDAPSSGTAEEKNPLAEDFDARSLLRFSFPTVFMMLFSGLYTIIDTIFVARCVNTDALSAVNIVTPVVNIVVGTATMLATGGSAIIARKMGAGAGGEARRNFALFTATGAAAGILFAAAGIFLLEPLLRALGASPALLPYCRDYLGTLLLFTPANMLQVLFAVFFVTAGRPGLGMGLGAAGGLANALFDYLFLVVFPLGVKGAAIATGIGYSIPAAAGIVFFLCNTEGTLFFAAPEFDPRALAESAFNGSSEMAGQLSAAVTTFLFNSAMMRLAGEDGVAAITIMIYSQFLLTAVFIGFSMGVEPVISYNFGGSNHRRLERTVRISLSVTLLVSIAVTAAALSLGGKLVGIFTAENSPVFAIARAGFFIFPFAFLFAGLNIFASALFTALSNGKLSAVLSFSRSGLTAAGIAVLPGCLGTTGVWLAVPLAEFVSLGLASWLFMRSRSRYRYL